MFCEQNDCGSVSKKVTERLRLAKTAEVRAKPEFLQVFESNQSERPTMNTKREHSDSIRERTSKTSFGLDRISNLIRFNTQVCCVSRSQSVISTFDLDVKGAEQITKHP
jgi:hypothetical protein